MKSADDVDPLVSALPLPRHQSRKNGFGSEEVSASGVSSWEVGEIGDSHKRRSKRGTTRSGGMLRRIDYIVGKTETHDEGRTELVQEALLPARAMHLLLDHIHFDPDGGILNIHDEVKIGAEVGKVSTLRKDWFEIGIAYITLFRIALNSHCHIWTGYVLISHYIWGTAFGEQLDLMDGNAVHQLSLLNGKTVFGLPLLTISVMIHTLELLAILIMLVVMFRDALWIVGGFDAAAANACGDVAPLLAQADQELGSPDVPDMPDTNFKYHRLKRLWWDFYPEFQNFSAIRPLGYVHPALMNRHFQAAISGHNVAARAVLERFFKAPADTMSDEALVDATLRALARADHFGSDPDIIEKEVLTQLRMTPAEATHELFQSDGLANKIALGATDLQDVDLKALNLRWPLRLLTCLYVAKFVLIVALCLGLGVLAFVVKLSLLPHFMKHSEKVHGQGWLSMLLPMIGFLNQVYGIVNVRHLLINRVQVFAFGGSDAYISTEENYLLEIYLAILQQKIWSCSSINGFQKLALMVMFDDIDLQELIVEEDPTLKAAIVLSVKKHMKDTGLVGNDFMMRLMLGVGGDIKTEKAQQ